MTPWYTLLAIALLALLFFLERWRYRSRIFRKRWFWVAWLIIVIGQILTDGWLTKQSAPIVIYNPDTFSGLRFPWDIPVEDFAFGFVLVTWTYLRWLKSSPNDS